MTWTGWRRRLLIAGTGLVGLVPGPCLGQEIPDSILESVDRFIESNWRRLGLPGLAVSVSVRDRVVLAKGFGGREAGGGSITEHTPFFIGSVTKTMTAFAIAALAEEGRLDLDEPVERYLPGFTMRPPFRPGTLSLRSLVHHRSGLSQWDGHDRRAQEEGRFEHLAPSDSAGGEAEYSSLNFIILGRVVEEASGAPYGRFLEEKLFGPLGMESAFTEGYGARPAHLAQGHRNLYGFNVPGAEPTVPPFLVPAGFVAASADDMGRYTAMLLGNGAFLGTRVVDSTTVDRILTPMNGRGPAMAWGRSRIRDALVFGHSGNTRTSSARVLMVPERGYAITVLANTNSGPFFDAPDALLDGVHVLLDGGPAPRVWPKERIFKGALLAATLLSVVGATRQVLAWRRAGYPVLLNRHGKLGRLAIDVGGSAFLIFGLPRVLGVPLSTMVEYLPDIGLGIALSAGAGVAGGLLRSFTASKIR